MGRTANSKQIRVFVDKKACEKLQAKSKELGMRLEHYAGLVLSGYKIEKAE